MKEFRNLLKEHFIRVLKESEEVYTVKEIYSKIKSQPDLKILCKLLIDAGYGDLSFNSVEEFEGDFETSFKQIDFEKLVSKDFSGVDFEHFSVEELKVGNETLYSCYISEEYNDLLRLVLLKELDNTIYNLLKNYGVKQYDFNYIVDIKKGFIEQDLTSEGYKKLLNVFGLSFLGFKDGVLLFKK